MRLVPAQALLLPCIFALALAAPAASQPVRTDSCFKPLLLQLQQRVFPQQTLTHASTACLPPLCKHSRAIVKQCLCAFTAYVPRQARPRTPARTLVRTVSLAQDFLSNPLSMATHFLSSLFGGGASSGILGMPGLPGLPAGLFGGSSAAAESAPGLPAAGPAPADTPAFTAAWAPESAPSAQGAPAPLAPARAAGAAHMAHKHVHAHMPHMKQADAAAPAAAHWDHIVEAVHRMGAARWEAARARLATSTPARRLLREGGPAGRTSGRAAAPLHGRVPVSSGCPSCMLAESCN